jgi:hypothetical protein
MANVRIQPSRALAIVKSNNADIPYPAVNTSGTSGGPVANFLVDATKNFQTLQVAPGDIVYNLTTGLASTVTASATSAATDRVGLNANIFLAAGNSYVIYQSSPFNGGQNTGCILYVGVAGDIVVTTAGNDIVTFKNAYGFMPIQVLKLWDTYGADSTSATDILALW